MSAVIMSSVTTDVRAARRLTTVTRVLLGLIFFVMGLNGFLFFLPPPASMPKGAMDFSVALVGTGYMMPLVMGTQVVSGALLLANRYVPLALAVLAPVIVNIVALHAFLMPSGLPMAGVVFALELYLAWSYRAVYRSMLAARVSPAAQ